MNVPSRQTALAYLHEAEEMNPGGWVSHSLYVAQAAEAIAAAHPELDPEIAFSLGCIHDIGRRVGVTDMRHLLDGYHFMLAEGYAHAARICVTHSLPLLNVDAVAGNWDCNEHEMAWLRQYVAALVFADYDKLLQLCDAIALPSGFALIEKRLLDVLMRHGVDGYSMARCRQYLHLKTEFDQAIGGSIYRLLPGIVENTFGWTG